MDVTEYLIVGAVIFVSGLVQSMVGFGYALFATPLLLFYGLPLPVIVVLVSVSSLLQSVLGAAKLHGVIPWRLSLSASGISFIGMISGVLLLKTLVSVDPNKIQGLVGVCICVLVIAQSTWKPSQTKPLHRHWGTTAFLSSGFLGGVCGMSGPPLVLWTMSQSWTSQKIRGFLFSSFAVRIPLQVALFGLAFGPEISWSILYGIMLAPFVYLGTRIGMPLGDCLDRKALQRAVFVILLIVGVMAIAQSW